MAIPIAANTTCDIYRLGVMPPAAPSIAAVSCNLRSDYRAGQEAGDRNASASPWTHIMLIDVSVDLRDSYTGQSMHSTQDAVYVPDKNGTRFRVIFIERVQRGTPHEHKRVYLDRHAPTWPSNEL